MQYADTVSSKQTVAFVDLIKHFNFFSCTKVWNKTFDFYAKLFAVLFIVANLIKQSCSLQRSIFCSKDLTYLSIRQVSDFSLSLVHFAFNHYP